MRIALIFPKSTFLSRSDVWPPLGLWYIGTQLEALGHETEFFDLSFDELPKDGDFDQAWVSATSPQMSEIKRISKETEGWTKTKTVLGGAAAWANPKACTNLGYDLVVSGEADHPSSIMSILYMAEHWDKGTLWSPEIHKTLDWVLPPIRRWSTRYYSYMSDKKGNQYRMTSLFTSRGCPMSCAFCESGRLGVIWGNMTRYEPIPCVEQQIKECKELGFGGLAYYDDIFIINKSRTLELLELHKKYNMVYRCFLRSDILCKHGGKEYLKQMQDGGLIEIFIGVESADNKIKENIHKGTTIEQDEQVLNWCKELGITCKCSFVFGLPGESKESMEKTRDWILKNRPDRTQVDRLIPFMGTPLADHPEEYDLKYESRPDEDWFFRGAIDLNSKSFVYTSHLSVEEIDKFWHSLELELQSEGLGQ